ncbi:MAG: universal stress protein [Hyphomicrobiales bacterium]
MYFKTILALHDVEGSNDVLMPALHMASDLDAHLIVLVIGLTPQPPMSAGYGAGAFEVWGEDYSQRSQDVKAKVDELEQWIQERKPSEALSFEVGSEYSEGGTLSREVGRRVRYCDLCVIPGRYQSESVLWQQALRGALYDTGRPLLLLNDHSLNVKKLERIMLGWDAGVQSSIAVKQAIGVLKSAKDVHIAMVDPIGGSGRFGEEPGADLATYLARHSIPVSVCALASTGKSVADTLNQHAGDMNAQLVIMGGYGHTRLQDWFLGSTTSHMLKSADCPLMLAH